LQLEERKILMTGKIFDQRSPRAASRQEHESAG